MLVLHTIIEGDCIGKELIINQGGSATGSITEDIDREVLDISARNTVVHTLKHGEKLFQEVIAPPPRLIIVGGVHIAVALTKIARACGFQVSIIDPRRQFGTQVRFPEANQLLHLWPDKAIEQIPLTRNTAIAFLTHDPKIDDPGLISALSSEAFYIGALGSRKTQASRRSRLIESGITEEQLDRIHGPIGLKLGGRSPEEIAVAIMAEIIQTRYE
jgi:xanthine dehydrogenase accessory factor